MVLKRRSRLVSFRLSEEEYQELCSACISSGARSISDLARTALDQWISSSNAADNCVFTSQMCALDAKVRQLRSEVEQLSKRLAEGEQ